jgi:opacity protein-like surface antigen
MQRPTFWRWLTACLAAVVMAISPVQALVRFNDGKDQIYVTGTLAYGVDSNIFATKGGGGDSTLTLGVNVEYQRRAGIIGVNAAIGWDIGRFAKFTSEDFMNPHMSLELTKDTGRTTGSLQLNAARQSSTDSAANLRTQSWAYGTNLNWKYPVVERYTLSGGFGYSLMDYQDNTSVSDLATFTANIDLFYVYNTERDLMAGYRYRLNDTSANTQDVDHNIYAGISGKIFSKLNGSLRVGYQLRQSAAIGPIPAETFTGYTVVSGLGWALTKRVALTGSIGKDFTTTSTNISTDSLTASLQADYTYNAKHSYFAGVGYGENKFLGIAGAGRRDYNFSWNAGLNYTPSEHFKVSLAYSYFQNWSNRAASNFGRNSVNLTLTSRW